MIYRSTFRPFSVAYWRTDWISSGVGRRFIFGLEAALWHGWYWAIMFIVVEGEIS